MRFIDDARPHPLAFVTAVLLISAGLCAQPPAAPDADFAIVGGHVYPVTKPPIENGVVLIKGKRIVAVGDATLAVPTGAKVIDAQGGMVLPGFIELHNHTGLSDAHDIVYQVNPELRVLDNIEFDTPAMKIACAGGVTSVLSIPGSGTNMGGFGAVVKTWGKRREDVLLAFPGALKIAQAGNPERFQGDLGSGRMGMNWMIRNVLIEGRAYHEAWTRFEKGETKIEPPKLIRYEYLRGLFRQEYPTAVHTQLLQVVQSTMRILHDELKLKVVIDHACFDSYILGAELAKRGIQCACGPRAFHYDQNQGRFISTSAGMYWLGVSEDDLTVNTDAPVVPEEELPFQGTIAIRLGVPEHVMLKGMTINAAKMLMIERRVGSLEPGKDADIAIWTGDPFDPRNRTRVVLVNGEVAYDAARDGIRF